MRFSSMEITGSQQLKLLAISRKSTGLGAVGGQRAPVCEAARTHSMLGTGLQRAHASMTVDNTAGFMGGDRLCQSCWMRPLISSRTSLRSLGLRAALNQRLRFAGKQRHSRETRPDAGEQAQPNARRDLVAHVDESSVMALQIAEGERSGAADAPKRLNDVGHLHVAHAVQEDGVLLQQLLAPVDGGARRRGRGGLRRSNGCRGTVRTSSGHENQRRSDRPSADGTTAELQTGMWLRRRGSA